MEMIDDLVWNIVYSHVMMNWIACVKKSDIIYTFKNHVWNTNRKLEIVKFIITFMFNHCHFSIYTFKSDVSNVNRKVENA